MRIELRDQQRNRIGRIVVDPALRPTRVSVTDRRRLHIPLRAHVRTDADGGPDAHIPTPAVRSNGAADHKEAFLQWDTALDDAGQLRRCVVCGCTELFRERAFPQVTGFVVVMAFAGAVVGVLGLATELPVLLALVAVLLFDISILVFSRRRLVCYRCRTTFHDLPIARYHRPWDRSVADRYPAPATARRSAPPQPEPPSEPEPAATPEEKGFFA
jgi:hypothetical protein